MAIRNFDSFKKNNNGDKPVKESVMQVQDTYRVKVFVDVPQSLINGYVKKVKDTMGDKNARQFFSDVDMAEELVKYVITNNVLLDKIPANALFGGEAAQAQAQPVQQVAQAQPQAQPEGQPQAQAQPQAQPEGQAQVQVQGDAQAPVAQAQPQGQAQGEGFEEVEKTEEEKPEGEESPEGEEEKGTEELPL